MKTTTLYRNQITDAQKEKLEYLSNLAHSLKEPAYENYDINNWESKPNTLLNLVYKKQRFDMFNILSNNTPIAMSGTYLWNNIPIIGVRAFTHPDYRGGGHWCQARHIFPLQIEYWESKGYNKVWMTFNEYNHRLVNFLRRMSEGRASTFGGPREIYQHLKWYDDTKTIQYTDQIVAELDISVYMAAKTDKYN
jgi:hypothetical protein